MLLVPNPDLITLSASLRRICLQIAFISIFNICLVSAEEGAFEELQPFFQQHCISCHGPNKQKGGLRIDLLSGSLDDLESVEHLQNMLDEINSGSMPPEDEGRPSEGELNISIPLLTSHVKAAIQKHSSGGGRPVRRLTKIELTNTVFDLMGVHINTETLPDDGGVGSFETQADALYTTDMFVENYLEIARDAVRRFIKSRNMKPGTKLVRKQDPPRGRSILIQSPPEATTVPPAGHLKVRIPIWKGPKSPRYVGPNGLATHEVLGTKKSPHFIERIYTTTDVEELWGIDKKVVGLGVTEHYQVVSSHPFFFFQKFVNHYGNRNPPDSSARFLISEFANLMSRGRGVDPAMVGGLNDIFLMGRKLGEPFWVAIVEPMALSMCSLEAMFHFEDKNPKKNSRYISAVELSNRLSYTVWRSAPDVYLTKLARNGDIYKPTIRLQQIDRMMQDEKFDRFIRDFTSQWLELERQDLIAVDNRLFPKFNPSVKESMKEETYQFMMAVIKRDLPLSSLIDSQFAFVNNLMADHYGLPKVEGDKFRAVRLPENSRRGGLLTQAGILMQTGTGDRTSIVERGVFISRKMLNADPPPPPPLVNDLPSGGDDFRRMTGAELVRSHAESAQCASCHNKFDPLGLGLEEFDAIGLYRKADVRLNPNFDSLAKKQRTARNRTFSVKLETEGKIYNGPSFKGSEGLKEALLKNQHRLAEGYVEALFTFVNGREAGIPERAIVEDIVREASKTNYRSRTIIKAVFESKVFKTN